MLRESLTSATAALMFIRPTNNMPKPMQIVPAVVALRFLTNMIRIMPIRRASGARLSDLKKYKGLSAPALTSMSRMICAVIAVPTFAPRTIPIDWRNFKKPAPTRPTVKTIVAVELWIIHVTSTPSRKASAGLAVAFSSAVRIAPPELLFRPSPMTRIPYKNSARPPSNDTA